MPNEHRPLNIFLSYASQDKPVVRELSCRLVGEGWIDTWLDEKNLLPGQDWRLNILDAVESCDIVIVCLSNSSVSKEGYVQKELRYAQEIALEKPEETIYLIPLRLDECNVPRGLRFYQWVDYFAEKKDESYKALIASLKLRYQQILKNEEERAKRQKEKQERDLADKLAREKLEREAVEELAWEKADRDAAEKAARTKAEEEAAERGRRNAVELARQKTAEKKVKIEQLSEPPVFKPYRLRKPNTAIIVAVIGLVGTLSAALISSPLLANLFAPTPTATQPPAPSETPTRVVTPTKAFTPTVTLFPTQITDPKGVTMRLVPAGEFTMGSDSISDNEKPVHQVYLDAYYMDKYEVTNAAYRTCVDAGQCTPPHETYSISRSRYYGYSEFDDYPVIYVDWNQAQAYCKWRGASLPTEAQWEKAARGTDGRTYPWGEGIDCIRANFGGPLGGCKHDTTFDTTRVGNYESGQSPFGIYDMVGNVWEWVADWYEGDYYQYSPSENPLGPRSDQNPDQNHSLRGGSWYYGHPNSALRHSGGPDFFYNDIGFRCARSLP